MAGRQLSEAEIAVVDEVIRQRRSIKPSTLADQPVDRALIQSLLEAANWAPSHYLTEPWRFVVIEGDARLRLGEVFLEALLQDSPDADDYKRAKVKAKPMRSPTLIAVIRQGGLHPKAKDFEDDWAVAAAVQNMAIAAAARGLGLFWSTGTPTFSPRVAAYFDCDENARLIGFLYIGWPGDQPWPDGRRGPVSEKTQWQG